MTADDTQLSVALRTSGHDWSWSSFVLLSTPSGAIVARAQINDDGDGRISPLSLNDRHSIEQVAADDFILKPRNGTSAQWQAEGRVSNPLSAVPLGFEISVSNLWFERPSTGGSIYHRIVYRGITLPDYTDFVWLKNGDCARRHGHTTLQVLDRDIIFSEIWKNDDPDECYVGVTVNGPWLSQLELDALEIILFLLAGVGGIRQCVESFDSNGRLLGRNHERLGHATGYDAKPLFSVEKYSERAFCEHIVEMIHRAKDLIESGLPLRALLFHLFASQQPIPEIAITHLGIALDGTKTAVIENIRGEGKLMDQSVFEKRIEPVLDAARQEFSATGEANARDLILRRIQDANDWSERERWTRFWRDHIGYTLTDREREVLEHRHPAIHNAYILHTEYDLALNGRPNIDRRPYGERLLQLVADAKVFRNVVNRVLLLLLGYQGEFVDSSDPNSRLRIGDGIMRSRPRD